MPKSNTWIKQAFQANAVRKGAVIRRSKKSVQKIVNRFDLLQEVKSRGFHLIETGGQYVILCNSGSVTLHA